MNGLTKAQYYKKTRKLTASGLVCRKSKNLFLTSFGKAIKNGKLRIDIGTS
ncbi:MAG TPA: hypothetical protein VH415_06060 [Nitrososphaeraceae archaeon]|jgi:hypothetical protein